MNIHNIYSEIPESLPSELFENLLTGAHFKLERIVSKGHATSTGTWCDQEQDEWVLLLKGRAGIFFEGDLDVRTLKVGDYVLIPARCRHRVEWTEPGVETVWLALHFLAAPTA